MERDFFLYYFTISIMGQCCLSWVTPDAVTPVQSQSPDAARPGRAPRNVDHGEVRAPIRALPFLMDGVRCDLDVAHGVLALGTRWVAQIAILVLDAMLWTS